MSKLFSKKFWEGFLRSFYLKDFRLAYFLVVLLTIISTCSLLRTFMVLNKVVVVGGVSHSIYVDYASTDSVKYQTVSFSAFKVDNNSTPTSVKDVALATPKPASSVKPKPAPNVTPPKQLNSVSPSSESPVGIPTVVKNIHVNKSPGPKKPEKDNDGINHKSQRIDFLLKYNHNPIKPGSFGSDSYKIKPITLH